jgi:uncharacterized protein YjbI with pentapeptide repeats
MIADANITTVKIGDAQITTAKIVDSNITTAKIADASITNAKIANLAVDEAKIASAAITNAKIADASISTLKVQDGAITNAKIGNASITEAKIDTAAVTNAKIANLAVDDAKISNLSGTKITANSITADKIVVGTGEVANGNLAYGKTVTGTIIGDNGGAIVDGLKINGSATVSFGTGTQNNNAVEVSYVQIDLGAVYRIAESRAFFYSEDTRYYFYKIKYSVDGTNWLYAVGNSANNGWVTSAPSVSGSPSFNPTIDTFSIPISARYVALYSNGNTYNAYSHLYEWELYSTQQTIIHGGQMQTGTLTADKLMTNTITASSGVIADAAITTAKIGDAQITGAKILDGTITNAEIANATILGANIADAAITYAKIADANITTAKIQDAAIITAKIGDAQITNAKIADATILDAKIYNLDGTKINANSITADKIVVGLRSSNLIINNYSISGDRNGWSAGGVITTDTFNGNTVNVDQIVSTANTFVTSDYIEVDPSVTYEVSLWLRETAVRTTGKSYIGIYTYDASKTLINVVPVSTSGTKGTANNNYYWYQLGVNGTTWKRYIGYAFAYDTNGGWNVGENVSTYDGYCGGNCVFLPNTRYIKIRYLNWSNAGVSNTLNVYNPQVTPISQTVIFGDTIKTGTITADKINANTITATSGVIANAAITNAMIADASITTAKISDAQITDAKIANATISSAKIANLDGNKITANTITTTQLSSTVGTNLDISSNISITSRVTSVEMNNAVDGLDTRITTAESKITPDAIVNTVSKSTISSSTPLTKVDDSDANITYSGTFDSTADASCSEGTQHKSLTTSNYIQYKFLGTGINVYSTKSADSGIMEIFIDNVSKGTVDLYNATTLYKQKMYTISTLAFESHTIKIVVTGTKNASATNCWIGLDYFEILNSEAVVSSNVISQINQTAEAIGVSADKINISGYTTLRDWANPLDNTKIDGGKIYTNSITSDKIAVGTLTVATIMPSELEKLLTKTINFKANFENFTLANNGEIYIHGYNSSGAAADVDGFFNYESVKYIVAKSPIFAGAVFDIGYILYDPVQNLSARTGANAITPPGGSSSRCIIVTYSGGQWKYDNNTTTLVSFTPLSTDLLIGMVFAGDSADLLKDAYAVEPVSISSLTPIEDARTLVKSWKSGTTLINGGMIATNTILANQLYVGDFTNLATVDEITGSGHNNNYSAVSVSGAYLVHTPLTSTYFMFNDYLPISFNSNEELYFEFYASNATSVSPTVKLWYYGSSKNNVGSSVGPTVTITSTETKFTGSISTSTFDIAVVKYFLIGLEGIANQDVKLRLVTVRRKNKGELIVDGSITGTKIAANTITAAKLVAGTITGNEIAANTITANKIVIADTRNYVAWSDKSDASASPWESRVLRDATTYYNAVASFKVPANNTLCVAKNEIPTKYGEKLYCEFYFKTASNWNGTVSLSKLRFADQNGAMVYSLIPSAIPNTSWVKYTGTFTVGSGVTQLQVSIGNDATTGDCWYDDIFIAKKNSGELIVDGSITATHIAANTITVDQLASNVGSSLNLSSNTSITNLVTNKADTSYVDQTATNVTFSFTQSSGGNLLLNSSGIGGTKNWYTTGTLVGEYNDGAYGVCKISGGYCLYLQNSTASEKGAWSTQMVLKPSTKYTVSGYYYVGAGSTGMDIYLMTKNTAYTGNGYNAGYDTAILLKTDSQAGTGVWKTFNATITTGSSVKSGHIRLDNNGSADAILHACYWGELMVTEGDLVKKWTPNATEIYSGSTKIDKNGLTVTDGELNVIADGRYIFKVQNGYHFNEWGMSCRLATGAGNVLISSNTTKSFNSNESCNFRPFGITHESLTQPTPLPFLLLTNTNRVEIRDLDANVFKGIASSTGEFDSYVYTNSYVSAVSYTTRSLRELKTNVTEYYDEMAYEGIKNIKIYNYNMDNTDAKGKPVSSLNLGVMVDEAPIEIVQLGGGDRADRKGINLYSYASYLASALKIAVNKIDNLEAIVEQLQIDVDVLKGA